MILRPKNKLLRQIIGSLDNCPHLKDMKGINLHISSHKCPIEKLCKYYEKADINTQAK